jgi:hypothetical protein
MGVVFDIGPMKPGNVAEMRRENQRHRQSLERLLLDGDNEEVVRELDRVVGALNRDKLSHQILFHAILGGVGEASVRVHDVAAKTRSPDPPVEDPVCEDPVCEELLENVITLLAIAGPEIIEKASAVIDAIDTVGLPYRLVQLAAKAGLSIATHRFQAADHPIADVDQSVANLRKALAAAEAEINVESSYKAAFSAVCAGAGIELTDGLAVAEEKLVALLNVETSESELDDLRKAPADAEKELNRLTDALPWTTDLESIVPEMELVCSAGDEEGLWWCSVVSVSATKVKVRDIEDNEYTVEPAALTAHPAPAADPKPESTDPKSPSKETTDELG